MELAVIHQMAMKRDELMDHKPIFDGQNHARSASKSVRVAGQATRLLYHAQLWGVAGDYRSLGR